MSETVPTPADQKSLRAVVVDDESLARTRLRRLLEEQSVIVIAEAEDAASALAEIEKSEPDIAFLDIHMPGLTGMQLAGALLQLQNPPLIAFVTGYAEYAADAFESDSLDYLLKPISADRLARTIARARRRIEDSANQTLLKNQAHVRTQNDAMTQATQEATTRGAHLRRVPIKADYAVRLLSLDNVISFDARQKSVFVMTPEGEAGRTYYSLTQLEALLSPDLFLRIHESYIVHLDRILELSFLGNHSYAVLLSDQRTLPVGKTRYPDLRRILGI